MIDDQRLDQFLAVEDGPAPDVAASDTGIPDIGPAPDAPIDFSEGEQVAGLGSVFSGARRAAGKAVSRGLDGGVTAAKAKADAAAAEAALPEAARLITPQVAEDIPLRAQAAQATQPPLTKPPEDLLNYMRTGLPDDQNRFIDEVAQAAGVVVPERISYKDAIAKLSADGFKAKDIEWIAGYANNTQQMQKIAKAREVLVAVTKNAHELATRVLQNPSDMKLAAEYHQMTQLLGTVTRGVKNIQTDHARALGIMRMNPIGDQAALTELVDSIGGIENVVAHAEKLAKYDPADPKNLAKIANLAEAGMWTKVKDAWLTTWINGLLSSPVTHAKNVVGNAIFAGLQIPERGVAAVIGKGDNLIRYMRGLDPRDTVETDEVIAMLQGVIAGSVDGLRTGARAFRENKPQFGTTSKLEGAFPQALSGDAFGLSGYSAKAMDIYGAMATIPGRALMAEDELFKVVNYAMELYAQASRRSSQEYRKAIAGGMSPDDADALALKVRNDILENPPADIDAAAMGAARVNTFTNPLATRSLGAKVQGLANQNLLVKMFLPFVRTPLNIVDQTIQRTPFAAISKSWRDDMAAGGVRRDMAMAKVATGTTMMTAFGGLAASGMITGSGPGKRGIEENLKRSGWQPYSFVLPNEWFGKGDVQRLQKAFGRDNIVVGTDKTYVSYQGIEPLGGMLAIVSDYAEYARWQDDVGTLEEVGMGAALGIANYTSTIPYLQSIGEFAALVGRGGDGPTFIKNLLDFAGKQAGGFLIGGSPAGIGSSAQAVVERIANPERSDIRQPKSTAPIIRGFYEAFDTYRSRVPGLSDDLPPKLDRWARPMKSGQGDWYELISPVRITKANQTPADKVLLENRLDWQMPPRTLSWQGDGDAFSGLSVELDAAQYNELLTIYAKELRSGGMDVQQAIVAASKDTGFEMLSLGQRQKYLKKVNDEYMSMARKVYFDRHADELIQQFQSKRNVVDAYGYGSDELTR